MKARYLLPLLFSLSYAWNPFSSDEKPRRAPAPEPIEIFAGPDPKCLSAREMYAQNTFRCPDARELVKDGLKWRTEKGWKGYQDSFATEISKFLGAQWKGVGVGRIVCLYETNNTADFPIQISSQRLVSRPSLPRWENNPRSSVVNCISPYGSPCDCPFSYYKEAESQSIEDIVQDLQK